jgi:hypothetical protein
MIHKLELLLLFPLIIYLSFHSIFMMRGYWASNAREWLFSSLLRLPSRTIIRKDGWKTELIHCTEQKTEERQRFPARLSVSFSRCGLWFNYTRQWVFVLSDRKKEKEIYVFLFSFFLLRPSSHPEFTLVRFAIFELQLIIIVLEKGV